MVDADAIELDSKQRDDFLGTGGTGVLAFAGADGAAPHAVPVSYGYDPAGPSFFFRLAIGEGSEKLPHLDDPVTFVTHDQVDGRWLSVIASGRLSETDERAIGADALDGLGRVHIPLVDIFGRPTAEVPFGFYRLIPDDLTARGEGSTAP